MFRYSCQHIVKRTVKHYNINLVHYMHLNDVMNIQRSISNTPYYSASIDNENSTNINQISGSGNVTNTGRPVERQGLCTPENLLSRLKIELLCIEENNQLKKLAKEVSKLKDVPEKRNKLLVILRKKVLEEEDNRIDMLVKLEKIVKTSSDKEVKEWVKLEKKIKQNSNGNLERINQFKEVNQGNQVEKIVIGAAKFVDQLRPSSDKLIGEICGFRNEVQADLKQQHSALRALILAARGHVIDLDHSTEYYA
ncbi:hypothetical protein HOY82DRAFT_534737 [Tuber indicum]|nr:hypothetical protein HOY82DRAFT_534737 [Tuber indicum]